MSGTIQGRRRFGSLTIGILFSLSGCSEPSDSGSTAPIKSVASADANLRKGVLQAINQERDRAKLPPLRENELLGRIAGGRAKIALDQIKEPGKGPKEAALKQNLDEQGYRSRRFDEFQQTVHVSIPVFVKEWSKTGKSAGLLMNNRRYSEIGIGRTADDLGQSYYSLIFAEPWPTIDTSYAAVELVEAVNESAPRPASRPSPPTPHLNAWRACMPGRWRKKKRLIPKETIPFDDSRSRGRADVSGSSL